MLSTSLLSTQHHVNTRDPAWSRVQLCFGMYRKVFTAKHSGSTHNVYCGGSKPVPQSNPPRPRGRPWPIRVGAAARPQKRAPAFPRGCLPTRTPRLLHSQPWFVACFSRAPAPSFVLARPGLLLVRQQQRYEDMSPINHSLGDGPPVRLSDLRLYYMLEYISPASYFCPFFSVVPSSTSDCDRTLPCVDRGSVMVHRCPLCTKRSTAPCAVSCNRHASQRPCRWLGGGKGGVSPKPIPGIRN